MVCPIEKNDSPTAIQKKICWNLCGVCFHPSVLSGLDMKSVSVGTQTLILLEFKPPSLTVPIHHE